MTASRDIRHDAGWGAVAGLISAAGVGFAAFWGAFLTTGKWYFPLELIGWSAAGAARFQTGRQSPTVLVSAIVQLATGTSWGALFGGVLGRFLDGMTVRDGMLLGAFFGVVAWVIDLSVLEPLGNPRAPISIPFWLGVFFHVSYGTALGALWASRRRVLRGRSDE